MGLDVELREVDQSNLKQAIGVAVGIFGDGDKEAIEEEFSASIGLRSNVPPIQSSKFFLAFHGDKPVGCTGYYKIAGHEKEVWLNWMGVLPEYRERGIGTVLVRDGFIQMAADKDIETLRIWTTLESDYACARKLYKNMGFVEEKYKPEATDSAKMVVVFSQSLNPRLNDGFLWKNSAYPIDAETHVIPDLNKKFGLGQQEKPSSISQKTRPLPL